MDLVNFCSGRTYSIFRNGLGPSSTFLSQRLEAKEFSKTNVLSARRLRMREASSYRPAAVCHSYCNSEPIPNGVPDRYWKNAMRGPRGLNATYRAFRLRSLLNNGLVGCVVRNELPGFKPLLNR